MYWMGTSLSFKVATDSLGVYVVRCSGKVVQVTQLGEIEGTQAVAGTETPDPSVKSPLTIALDGSITSFQLYGGFLSDTEVAGIVKKAREELCSVPWPHGVSGEGRGRGHSLP